MTSFIRQFSGNLIFPDEKMAMEFFDAAPKQPAQSVAVHTMELIKHAKNGSIWLSDSGTLKVIAMKTYCIPSE